MNHLKWGKFFKYLKIYENKCKDGDKNGVLFSNPYWLNT